VTSEALQAVVYSRSAQGIDCLAAVGAMAFGYANNKRLEHWLVHRPVGWQAGLCAAAAVLYSVAVCGLLWYPFDWTDLPARHPDAWATLFKIPFYSHYRSTEFRALSNLVVRSSLFGVVGFLWARALAGPCQASSKINSDGTSCFPVVMHFVVLISILLGLFIEVGQIFLPSKTADWTDIFVGALAAALGCYWACRLEELPLKSQ
jgi:hypothetical protein